MKSVVRSCNKNEVLLSKNHEETAISYTFDEVFDESTSQSHIYESIASPIVRDMIRGYNCTLFAYGASDSGKSHTMIGDERNIFAPKSIGLLPRTINGIFQTLNKMNVEFNVKISYLEIINEELVDLLAPISSSTTLKIFENAKGQLTVNGLTEKSVSTIGEAFDALQKGKERLGASHRSHSIFAVMTFIKDKSADDDDVELLKISKFNLVELVGSDSAIKGVGDKTARHRVNQSLISFNRVVLALIDKQGHVPYRDTKLTRILQESLGGNSKTSIIATVAPGLNHIEETTNTLEFVTRAKAIHNRPQINKRVNKTILLQHIDIQINQLKMDIEASRTRSGKFLTEEAYSGSVNQLDTSVANLKNRRQELRALNAQREKLIEVFSGIESTVMTHEQRINEVTEQLNEMEKQKSILERVLIVQENQIEKFTKTQKMLSEQSQVTSQVIQLAGADAKLLHSSVDRRHTEEEKLKRAQEEFTADMTRHINRMQELLEMNVNAVAEQRTSYNEKYGKLAELPNWISLFTKFISISENFLAKTSNAMAVYREKIVNTSKDREKSNAAMNEKALSKANQILLQISPKRDQLESVWSNFQKFSNEFHVASRHFDEARHKIDEMVSFFAAIFFFSSLNLFGFLFFQEQMQDRILEMFDRHFKIKILDYEQKVKTILIDVDQVNKIVSENNAKAEKMMENILQMEQMVELLKKNSHKISVKAKAQIEGTMKRVQDMCNSTTADIKLFEVNTLSQIEDLRLQFDASHVIKSIDGAVASFRAKQHQQSIQLNAMKAKQHKSIGEIRQMADSLLLDVDKCQVLKANIDKMDKLEEEFADLAAEVENERAECNDKIAKLRKNGNDFVGKFGHELLACHQDVNRLLEIIQYNSDGESIMDDRNENESTIF